MQPFLSQHSTISDQVRLNVIKLNVGDQPDRMKLMDVIRTHVVRLDVKIVHTMIMKLMRKYKVEATIGRLGQVALNIKCVRSDCQNKSGQMSHQLHIDINVAATTTSQT